MNFMWCYIVMILRISVVQLQGNNSYIGYWTAWYNENTPLDGSGDRENVEDIENKQGYAICRNRYTIYYPECRTNVSNDWLVFREKNSTIAPNVLIDPCTNTGVECRDADQIMGVKCFDYQIRFMCYRIGEDIIQKTDDALALICLFVLIPITAVIYIKVRKRNCCRRQLRELPYISRTEVSSTGEQQVTIDPPPSYDILFPSWSADRSVNPSTNGEMMGHVNPTFQRSTENLSENTTTENDIGSQREENRINTLSRSNLPSISSVLDRRNRRYQEGIERPSLIQLSITDMYYRCYDATPPPSYNDALVILAAAGYKSDVDSDNDESSQTRTEETNPQEIDTNQSEVDTNQSETDNND